LAEETTPSEQLQNLKELGSLNVGWLDKAIQKLQPFVKLTASMWLSFGRP
jgi:hypothetical protein